MCVCVRVCAYVDVCVCSMYRFSRSVPPLFPNLSFSPSLSLSLSQTAAKQVYEQVGLGPEDAQVVELHDCFSANELITYDALGLCKTGRAGDLIDDGQVTYGGRYVVNPSGGLISKGHPLGTSVFSLFVCVCVCVCVL